MKTESQNKTTLRNGHKQRFDVFPNPPLNSSVASYLPPAPVRVDDRVRAATFRTRRFRREACMQSPVWPIVRAY